MPCGEPSTSSKCLREFFLARAAQAGRMKMHPNPRMRVRHDRASQLHRAQECCYGKRLVGVGGNTLVTTALRKVRSWVWFSYRSIFTLDVTSVRRSGWWWRRRISGTPMSSPLLPLHCKIATRHTVQTSKPTNRTTSSSSLEGSGLVL